MNALRTDRRRGMTLIELVVVIGLILLLATLALLISPRLAEDQRSVRTADLVSGWLLMCKQRAYRDQQTRGLRLIQGQDGNCREIMLVERPEDYRGGALQVPSPFWQTIAPMPPANKAGATAFLHGKDLTNGNPPDPTAEPIVEAYLQNGRGDFLVFDSLEPIPYNSHFIASMTYVPPNAQAPQGGTHLVLATFDLSRYSVINGGAPIYPNVGAGRSTEFRFVRGPRPLVGEPTLQLPRDMIIDLPPLPLVQPWNPNGLPPAEGGTILPGVANSAQRADILFSPRGQLQGANSSDGKVVLRIRNGTRGPRDGDQLLVVIYTRSGIIATHPVNITADATGALVDPYGFLRDGESSGF